MGFIGSKRRSACKDSSPKNFLFRCKFHSLYHICWPFALTPLGFPRNSPLLSRRTLSQGFSFPHLFWPSAIESLGFPRICLCQCNAFLQKVSPLPTQDARTHTHTQTPQKITGNLNNTSFVCKAVFTHSECKSAGIYLCKFNTFGSSNPKHIFCMYAIILARMVTSDCTRSHQHALRPKNLFIGLFFMGCFPENCHDGKRCVKANLGKCALRSKNDPLRAEKGLIEAMLLVGVAIGCLMSCFGNSCHSGKRPL